MTRPWRLHQGNSPVTTRATATPQELLKGKLDKEYLRDLLKNVEYALIEALNFAT